MPNYCAICCSRRVRTCAYLELGASGYLVKGAADREIVEAIHRAARSLVSMSAELATACFRELLRDVSESKKAEVALLEVVRKAGHDREELLVHLVRAQETERLRIASDIHDDNPGDGGRRPAPPAIAQKAEDGG